jgi:hypothetical protein
MLTECPRNLLYFGTLICLSASTTLGLTSRQPNKVWDFVSDVLEKPNTG